MKLQVIRSLFAFFAFLLSIPVTGAAGNFFDDADRFFMAYAQEGGVLYEELANDPQVLDELVADIDGYNLTGKDVQTRKAFYINAYNVLMIKTIVDHYPVNSPLDIEGVFSKIEHPVAGIMLTLDEIEKEILMKEFFDPRLHFVLVCGAKGCPPLADFAYRPENLDKQLEEQTTKALNDPEFIRVDKNGSEVALSQIFKWYKSDFSNSHDSLIEYVNGYRKNSIPSNYSVRFYEYDWSLNLKKKVK